MIVPVRKLGVLQEIRVHVTIADGRPLLSIDQVSILLNFYMTY